MKKNHQKLKFFILTFSFFLFSYPVLADKIEKEISKKVAINAFSENSGLIWNG
jgi:hypothetical protein